LITLYQFPISPFCDKIRRILQYKRVEYSVHNVPMLETPTTLRKKNKAGKVPCIEDAGTIVSDSTDIAHHLEARFPDPPLLPREPKVRALCHILEDWADESLYFYEVFLRFMVPSNAPRWIAELVADDPIPIKLAARWIIPSHMRGVLRGQGLGRKTTEAVCDDLRRELTAIEDYLGDGKFLLGDAISLADIAVFAQLHCIRGTPEGGAIVADRPVVARWMDRVDAKTSGSPANPE
jgi:glutathione S-transferase